jgi:hypothetical protein
MEAMEIKFTKKFPHGLNPVKSSGAMEIAQ